MMGLRLREGISEEAFFHTYGQPIQSLFPKTYQSMQKKGLLEKKGDRLCLTHQGSRLANEVFVAFLEEID